MVKRYIMVVGDTEDLPEDHLEKVGRLGEDGGGWGWRRGKVIVPSTSPNLQVMEVGEKESKGSIS